MPKVDPMGMDTMSATLINTDQTQEASRMRPRLYDFAEGWGSIYGRYVRNRLSKRLVQHYKLHTVLEAPCNAESYFASPGTQSVVFAQEGCSVTLLHPDENIVEKTCDFWAALGIDDVRVLHHTDLNHMPFADRTFDLVWNFDSVPLAADPEAFLAEMARVSAYLVLVILPNPWNIGYPVHRALMKLHGSRSAWGSPRWMDARLVRSILRRSGMKIVETGLVDMPPWPGFDVLHTLGTMIRRNTVEAHEDTRTDNQIEETLRKLSFIEYAPVPQILKTPFSHQRYIIARKART